MQAVANAELEGFAELVHQQSAGWIAAAAVIVGDRHRAEEIVQDVLGRAYSRWGELESLDRPGAWIQRAVTNDAISAWRRIRTEGRALDRLQARRGTESVTPADPSHELWDAVRRLPEDQCRAIALHYGADVAVADIATELDLSLSATKTVLFRARRTLRERLNDEENRDD